jgi:3-deoxy-D-manno-octulosonic-acid transferase
LFSITRPLLVGFSKICAISDIHADRLIALGAPVDSIQVTGNAKFEGLLYKPNLDRVRGFRNRLKIDDSTKVLVAGSLRRGEEREIINAYDILRSQWSDMVCFLVPRHLKMVSSIVNALKKKSMPYQLWSDLEINQQRTEKVIVVDVIGPLFDLYGLATAAFVGGSLIPKGGQNLLEPAAWSCPVVYGPHTDNFEEAKMALESSGGGQCVNSGRELAEVVNLLFVEPLRRREKGKKSRKTLEDLAKGVATKQTDILLEVLESKNRSG